MENINIENWQGQFDEILDSYGHRNWILITDKAFPKQSSQGMKYINTYCDLPNVLEYVIEELSDSLHVKPVIYTDKELAYITEEQAEGVDELRNDMSIILKDYDVETLLHDDVFKKLDESSSLFETLVLKTNCTVPYSSVFIFLDCAYWTDENEKALREVVE